MTTNRPVILHFIETDIPGGAESMLFNLCTQQKESGLRPMIAHFDHPYFLQRCRTEGIESFALPPRHLFKKIATLPFFCVAFAKKLRNAHVTLLHSHLFGPIVAGAISAKLAGIPHVGTLHDIFMIEDEPTRIRQLQIALLLGSRLVAVSQQMQIFYQSRLRWRKDKVHCIYNGLPQTQTAIAKRCDFDISDNAFVVIIVGRLIPLKRIQDAINAVAMLKELPIALLIVGDGPEKSELEKLATQLEQKNSIRFLGARDDVSSLLPMADIFLQCSETEGLSMSIIEALHASLPCVVTQVGGNGELVYDDCNGFLYPCGATETLVSLIRKLSDDDELRARFAKNAKALAVKEFTIATSSKKYSALYGQLNGLREAF